MSWSETPTDILHAYRHAYKLPTPSAFSTEYSRILLSQGIGLQSPTSIAARRSQISYNEDHHEVSGNLNKKHIEPNYSPTIMAAIDARQQQQQQQQQGHAYLHGGASRKDRLNSIIGQGRVGKNQLALAVRKHFNSAGLVEQEAVARFLYKLHEDARGHQFRIRFQP